MDDPRLEMWVISVSVALSSSACTTITLSWFSSLSDIASALWSFRSTHISEQVFLLFAKIAGTFNYSRVMGSGSWRIKWDLKGWRSNCWYGTGGGELVLSSSWIIGLLAILTFSMLCGASSYCVMVLSCDSSMTYSRLLLCRWCCLTIICWPG